MSDAPAIPDEQAALLAAIVADPDDDTPRLVYADWLQENGDEEQAGHIRESVRVARLSESERRDPAKALRAVERLKGSKWLEAVGVSETEGFDHSDLRWPPGAVIYRSTDGFFADAPTLFARLPVRDLAIYWFHSRGLDSKALRQIAAMPELARLHALRLANYGHIIELDAWEELIRSPHLRGLRTLECTRCLPNEHALALAECENLRGLTELNLAENGITATGALAVLNSPHLAGVTYLTFAANDISEHDPNYQPLVATFTARFGSDETLFNEL